MFECGNPVRAAMVCRSWVTKIPGILKHAFEKSSVADVAIVNSQLRGFDISKGSAYGVSSGTVPHLFQSVMTKHYIDSAYLQERRRNSTSRCICLILRNGLTMTENLGGRGNERDQVGELFTEFLDAGFVDQEEEVGLSLTGKTSPVKS